jgi:hypothetical protein
MSVCVCCNRERADVKIRVGLRTLDTLGKTTTKPFHGPLCDDCLLRVTRIGSVEQRWLLQQIIRTEPERQVFQKPNAPGRREVVVSFRPISAKPRAPRHRG